jgi:hypothetical protein
MNRREVFPILGAVTLGLHAAAPAKYKPRALTQAEYDLVTVLANLILPADETSAGAGDAGTAFYVDTFLFRTADSNRSGFKTGLQPLLGLDRDALDVALAKLAEDESKSGSFFSRLKLMTIDAYCMSPEGRKFLRYSGDSVIGEFKGCNHPEHQRA